MTGRRRAGAAAPWPLRRNLAAFYAYRLTKNALFHVAVLVPFYRAHGLDYTQIMLVQSVYYIAKALCDVPAGAFADSVGRRRALTLGSVVHAASYLCIFLGHGLPLFALGEGLSGLGMSLASAADSAIAYDTLLAAGRSADYQRVEGVASALRVLGIGVVPAAGSLLATIDIGLPYLFSAAVILMSGLIALAFVEVMPQASAGPPLAVARRRPFGRDVMARMKAGVGVVAASPRL